MRIALEVLEYYYYCLDSYLEALSYLSIQLTESSVRHQAGCSVRGTHSEPTQLGMYLRERFELLEFTVIAMKLLNFFFTIWGLIGLLGNSRLCFYEMVDTRPSITPSEC